MILSIENHCSVVQQKKMAQYLTDILGDKLDLSSVGSEDTVMLPSPQMLKGKILVKVSFLGLSWRTAESIDRLGGGTHSRDGHIILSHFCCVLLLQPQLTWLYDYTPLYA